jgi:predicted nucleic acid-binding protein
MAGSARYTALLDACVLYPIITADALLSLAAEGLFNAKWTQRIESEWMAALLRDRPDLDGRLDSRRDGSRAAIPDWEVEEQAWTPISRGLELPDPRDAHVLAAAIAGHCDCIVTANLKDFPEGKLRPHSIEAVHPDDFIVAQIDLDPISALSALKAMRLRRQRPTYEATVFADRFEACGLPRTAERLRQARTLI